MDKISQIQVSEVTIKSTTTIVSYYEVAIDITDNWLYVISPRKPSPDGQSVEPAWNLAIPRNHITSIEWKQEF